MALSTPARRIPRVDTVRGVLTDLLGSVVTVGPGAVPELDDGARRVSTVFTDEHDRVRGAMVADLEVAAAAAAALRLRPPGTVSESLAAPRFPPALLADFGEVVHLLSALWNGPSLPRLQMRDVVSAVSPEARRLISRATSRCLMEIAIRDHGGGQLSFWMR